MTHTRIVIAAACLSLAAGVPLAGLDDSPAPYAYHLRIVRVSGATTNPGAAVGWTDNGGIPVMLPSAEPWGDPEQLAALAQALGGERADAVTGFFVTADQTGAKFDRRVYLADAVIDLAFDAVPPAPGAVEHRLTLRLDSPELEDPLAEARLLVRTERTVAIASPSPHEDDWLVLGVTLVDQGRLAESRTAKDRVLSPDDAGVSPPEAIHKPPPRYPEAARKDRVQGHVVVMAMIDEQGAPHAPMVTGMTPGAEELAAAAVDSVASWRFEPATLNGQPVAVYFTTYVQFRLQ